MKRSLKVLILIFMLFVLSGCTTDCSLDISKDGVLSLEIDAIESTDYINGFMMEDDEDISFIKNWLNGALSRYKKIYPDMTISYVLTGEEYIGKGTKKLYKATDLKNLTVLTKNFDSVNVTSTDSIVNIEIKGLSRGLVDQISYYENEITLKVTLPFVVLSSNASSVDRVNNVYTWNLSENKRNIIIKYDSNQIYEYKEEEVDNSARTRLIIVAGCVLAGLVVVAIGLSIKSKIEK